MAPYSAVPLCDWHKDCYGPGKGTWDVLCFNRNALRNDSWLSHDGAHHFGRAIVMSACFVGFPCVYPLSLQCFICIAGCISNGSYCLLCRSKLRLLLCVGAAPSSHRIPLRLDSTRDYSTRQWTHQCHRNLQLCFYRPLFWSFTVLALVAIAFETKTQERYETVATGVLQPVWCLARMSLGASFIGDTVPWLWQVYPRQLLDIHIQQSISGIDISVDEPRAVSKPAWYWRHYSTLYHGNA